MGRDFLKLALAITALLTVPAYAELAREQINAEIIATQRASALASKGRYGEAFVAWQALAAAGNAQGMVNTAQMLRLGQGVNADPALALSWYHRAGAQGNKVGLLWLYFIYRDGLGTPADPQRAAIYRYEAAGAGAAEAQFDLGAALLAQNDKDSAIEWLKKAEAGGAEGAGALLAHATIGYTPPVGEDPALQRRALRLLEEMDSAIHSRDADMLLAAFSENAVITLRLPGQLDPQTFSPTDYAELWRQTFLASERLRLNRLERTVTVDKATQTVYVDSNIMEYLVSDGDAQRLKVREQLQIRDNGLGLRVAQLNMTLDLPSDPIVTSPLCLSPCNTSTP